MSLIDIFGRTDELTIIDFLSSNSDCAYTVYGIKECLNEHSDKWFSKFDIEYILAKLIYNGIVEICDNHREEYSYKIADNKMTKCIGGLALLNSDYVAKKPSDDEDIDLKEIRNRCFS